MGLDTADFIGAFANMQTLLPLLSDVIMEGSNKTGVGLALKGGKKLLQGTFGAGFDALGQWFDDHNSQADTASMSHVNLGETILAGAMSTFGNLVLPAIKSLVGKGYDGRFVSEVDGPSAGPLKRAWLSTFGEDQIAAVRSAENAQFNLTVANMSRSGIVQRLIQVSKALNPELYTKVSQEQSQKLYNYLNQKVDSLGSLAHITSDQLGGMLNKMAADLRRDLWGEASDPTSTMQVASFRGKLAAESLKKTNDFYSNIRNETYEAILRNPRWQDFSVDLDLSALQGAAESALRQVPGEKTVVGEVDVAASPLMDEFGLPLGGGGKTVTETDVLFPIGGGPGAGLKGVSEDILALKLGDPITTQGVSAPKQMFGVLEQVHALRQRLSEIAGDDLNTSQNQYIHRLQDSLEEVWDQAQKKIDDNFGEDSDISGLYSSAKMLSSLLNNNMRAGYVGRALAEGRTRPFENLIDPILEGKVNNDDLMALSTVFDSLGDGNSAVALNIPKRFLGEHGAKLKMDLDKKELEALKGSFFQNLQDAASAKLVMEPGKLPMKIKEMTGFGDLSDDQILENPNFKFFFPSRERRQELVKQAQILERFADARKPMTEILGDSGLTRAELGSQDILNDLVSLFQRQGGQSLQEAGKIFDNLAGDNKGAVKKQLQEYFLSTLLRDIGEESTAEGAKGIAFKRISNAVEDMRSTNKGLGDLYDYVMQDLPDLGTIVTDISRLGKLLQESSDMGSGIAATAEAKSLEDKAFGVDIGGIINVLTRQRVFASIFTSPVRYADLQDVLNMNTQSTRFWKSKVAKSFGKLMMKEAINHAKRPEFELNNGQINKIIPMSFSDEKNAAARSPSEDSPSRLRELFPTLEEEVDRTFGPPISPDPQLKPQPEAKRTPPGLGASLGSPATNPAPGGIASLAGLAGLEKVGMPLFT